jgi:membrane protein YqaA with SNARE-associated domain
MTFSIEDPSRMVVFATFTTVGSIIGCSILYSIGRTGGEAFLRRRIANERVRKMERWYRRYGVLAVVVPSLLPPPTPFKIFVLSAGTFGIGWPKFIGAVALGRGIRYFSEGLLAVYFGPSAIQFVQQNIGNIGIIVAGGFVVGTILFVYARRRIPGGPSRIPVMNETHGDGTENLERGGGRSK